MRSIRLFVILCFFCSSKQLLGQVEIGYAKLKDFSAFGYGAFINLSIPASESNYATIEAGIQYFKNEYDEDAGYIPIFLGYKYTLNQSGSGFYLHPQAGYAFGESTIQDYDENGSPLSGSNGDWIYKKIKGPIAGVGFGYLLDSESRLQLNFELRYQHSFAKDPANIISLRIAKAFSLGNRNR